MSQDETTSNSAKIKPIALGVMEFRLPEVSESVSQSVSQSINYLKVTNFSGILNLAILAFSFLS